MNRRFIDYITILGLIVLPLRFLAVAADNRAEVIVRYNPESPTRGIQEAVDSIPKTGGSVYIPAGRYDLQTPIQLLGYKNITIKGAGPGTILEAPEDYLTFLAEDVAANSNRIKIKAKGPLRVGDALSVCDNKTSQRLAVLVQIAGFGGKDTVILKQPLKRGFKVSEKTYISRSWPLLLAKVEKCNISDMQMTGSLQKNYRGYSHWGRNSVLAVNGAREGSCVRLERLDIHDAPADAIMIGGEGVYTIRDCRIVNTKERAIHLGNWASRIHVAGNYIEKAGLFGVYFCHGIQNTIVSGNIIKDIGFYRTGGKLFDRSKKWTAKNESFIARHIAGIGGLGGGAAFTGRGPNPKDKAPGSTRNIISNNLISHSSGCGISFLRREKEVERPGKFINITGNTIEDTDIAGIYLFAAEFSSVNNNIISGTKVGIDIFRSASCSVRSNLIHEAKTAICISSDKPAVPATGNLITGNLFKKCGKNVVNETNIKK